MQLKSRVSQKVAFAAMLLRDGSFREVGDIARTKLWYEETAIGLARDLTIPFAAPEARIPITVRKAHEVELRRFLAVDAPGLDRAERYDRHLRIHLLEAGFSTCYVAVTDEGELCYVQWLMTPDENHLVRRAFGDMFPQLAEYEVLLEGAYTPATYRGLRIMPSAMARIAEHAAADGYTRAFTFVGETNMASRKGCERAGFYPYATRHATHRMGFCRVVYSPHS